MPAAANIPVVLQPGRRGQLFVTFQRCPLILSYILAQMGLQGEEQGHQSPTSILANREWYWPCCITSSHETPSCKVLSGSLPCARHWGPESHNPPSPGHEPQQPQGWVPVPTSVHAPEPWGMPQLGPPALQLDIPVPWQTARATVLGWFVGTGDRTETSTTPQETLQ